MAPPSSLIPGDSRFGSTKWSVVLAARDATDADRRAHLEQLFRLYWKPVYAFIRRSWARPREDAKDLAQAFFADLLERPFLDAVSPDRGRFRTYLRTCVRNFLANAHDRETALKRGGGRAPIPLDWIRAEDVEPENGPSPEALFDREWAQAVLAEALRRLRAEYDAEDRSTYFAVLEKSLDDGDISYDRIAGETGLKRTDVSNYLLHARGRLREIVRELVRDSVADDANWQTEFAALFGA
jgi:RNA polymerase sigma-70 factor (ECF subfamily)